MTKKPEKQARIGDIVWYAPGNDRQKAQITAISGNTSVSIRLLTGPRKSQEIADVPWGIIEPLAESESDDTAAH